VLLVAPAAVAQTTNRTQQDPGASAGGMRGGQYYTRQGDEIRASNLIGASVRNKADERIGEINEVILKKDGKVAAVVVGVGGFLGIGEREVALSFDSLKIEMDPGATTATDSLVVRADHTKKTLTDAPAWTWRSGSGGTSPAAPSGQPQTAPQPK
jgi:hypothetical protein